MLAITGSFWSCAASIPIAWGKNDSGQLGIDSTTNSLVPTAIITSGVLAGKTVIALAAGGLHTLALTADGKVFAWGTNNYGQLGNGTTTESHVPVAVTMSGALSGKTVIAIAAGFFHSLALTSDGQVFAWGSTSYGQLGILPPGESHVPAAVTTSGVLFGKTIVAIAAGTTHSLALSSDGQVFAWGHNSFGELGNNSTATAIQPVAVATNGALSGKTVVAIAAGGYHNLALSSEGRVFSWGNNASGQLGNASTTSSSLVPVQTSRYYVADKVFTAIAAGDSHSLALTSDGQVFCWGFNGSGELGLNNTELKISYPWRPTTNGLLEGKAIVAVAGGSAHTLALTSEGQIYAWGLNVYGQLGDNSTVLSRAPAATSTNGILNQSYAGALAVGSKAGHSLAVAALPYVVGVSGPPARAYGAGEDLDFRITYNQAVSVDTAAGVPSIRLMVGNNLRSAAYQSGTGSSLLRFRYTTTFSDTDPDGVCLLPQILLNGGTIQDGSGGGVALTFNPVFTSGVLVDTTVSSIPTTPDLAEDTDTGVSVTDDVTRITTPRFTGRATTGTTVKLFDSDGTTQIGSTTPDSFGNWNMTTTALTEGAHQITAKAMDAQGTASASSQARSILIDTTAPIVTNVTSTTANGYYTTGIVINVTMQFTEPVVVTGSPAITLALSSGNRSAVYAGGSGSSALSFSYVIQTGDTAPHLDYSGPSALDLRGGAIQDVAGNDAALSLPLPGTAGSLGKNKQIAIDTTPPAVLISPPSAPRTRSGPVSYRITVADASPYQMRLGTGTAIYFGTNYNSRLTLNKTGTADATSFTGSIPDDDPFARVVTLSGIHGDGTLGISLGLSTALDAAVNDSLATGPSATFTVDNTAPLLTGNATLAPVNEHTTEPPGETVGTLLRSLFSDAASALAGIAIYKDPTNRVQGAWQYSTDHGQTWLKVSGDLPVPGSALVYPVDPWAALLLDVNTLLRFVPLPGFSGKVDPLAVFALENSEPTAFTSGTNRTTLDTTPGHATTKLSVQTALVLTSITPLNDPPSAAFGAVRQAAKLEAIDGAGEDLFGAVVAIFGNTAAVGAPHKKVGTNLEQGCVYIYRGGETGWRQEAILTGADGRTGDLFGSALAILGDRIVVGAPGSAGSSGTVYLFSRTGSSWTQEGKLNPFSSAFPYHFGASVAIDYDIVVVGAPGVGYVYTFLASGWGWLRTAPLIGEISFGESVAVSGNTLLVGHSGEDVGGNLDQGSATAYTWVDRFWAEEKRLIAADGAANDKFGASVALFGDTAVIGASRASVGTNEDQGAAYVFSRAGANWTQIAKLTAPGGTPHGLFGTSVGVDADEVVIGAPGTPSNRNAGAAFVYRRKGATWGSPTELKNDGEPFVGRFGASVGISGSAAIIGRISDSPLADQASAHLFSVVPITNLEISEDSAIIFSSTNNNLGSLSDPDARENPLKVLLQASHGTLSLSDTTGLSFADQTGNGQSQLSFAGSPSYINAALDGLQYLPSQDFNGSDTLTFTVDDQGNSGMGGPLAAAATVTIKVTPVNDPIPIAISAPSSAFAASGPVTYTATYPERNVGDILLAPSDITLNSSGSATGTVTVAGSGTSRTVTISNITGEGAMSIAIREGTAIDATGNFALATGPSSSFVVDNTKPAVAISGPSVSLTRDGPVSYTVAYSDANFSTSTLSVSDITLNTTGTATGTLSVTESRATRIVTISNITGDGTLGISLAAATATDAAGNSASAAGPSATFAVDNTRPAIAISGPSASLTRDGPVTYTLAYSDANFSASTLSVSDITLNTTGSANGTVTVGGSGAARTVTISNITGDGTLGISLDAATATDTAGNSAGAAGPSATFAVDNTKPVVMISGPSASLTGGGPVSYTITYSDANFSASTLSVSDITLNTTGTANGSISVTGSGATRTVTISNITSDGTLGISLAAASATDFAGNTATAAGPSATFVVDNTRPTVTISGPSANLTGGGPVSYTVAYSDANFSVSTLSVNDITLNATGTATGTLSVTGSGATRTVTISNITGDGTLGISLASATATDTAGNNASAAGPSAAFAVDNTRPLVTLSGPSAALTRNGPITYTVTYTDANFSSSTLTANDIVLSATGTAAGNVEVGGSDATRIVTISQITGDGTLGISLAPGSARDRAGNTTDSTGASGRFEVDNTKPSVTISEPSFGQTGQVSYLITYADPNFRAVTLSIADITLNKTGSANAALSLSGTGGTRTVTLSSITGVGTLGISIGPGTASDLADNPADSAGPSATFDTLGGAALDGYVAGGIVCFDANQNHKLDPGEPSATTGSDGKFVLNLQASPFDRNGNGKLDPSEGMLLLAGGRDISTGLPLKGELAAPFGSTAITPLTTLIVTALELNPQQTLANVQSSIAAGLGLPVSVDLTRYDPIAALPQDGALALKVLSATAQVQDTIVETAALLAPSASQGADELIRLSRRALLNQILSDISGLGNTGAVQTIILSAAQSSVSSNLTFFQAAAAAIASNNAAKGAVSNVVELVRLQGVAQRELATALGEAAAAVPEDSLPLLQETLDRIGNMRATVGSITGEDLSPGQFNFADQTFQVSSLSKPSAKVTVVRSGGNAGSGSVSLTVGRSVSVLLDFADREISRTIDLFGFVSTNSEFASLRSAPLHLEQVAPPAPGSPTLGSVTNALFLLQTAPILTDPTNVTSFLARDIVFATTARGYPRPLLQWTKNGAPLDGQTNSVLLLKGVQPVDEGIYQITAANPAGSVVSRPASLSLLFEPILSGGTPFINVLRGTPVTLQFAIQGTQPINFQWRKNGIDLGGRTNATLNLGRVAVIDSGSYSLIARNTYGATASTETLLNVEDVIFRFLSLQPRANGNLELLLDLPQGHRYRLEQSFDLKTWRSVTDLTPFRVPQDLLISPNGPTNQIFFRATAIQ